MVLRNAAVATIAIGIGMCGLCVANADTWLAARPTIWPPSLGLLYPLGLATTAIGIGMLGAVLVRWQCNPKPEDKSPSVRRCVAVVFAAMGIALAAALFWALPRPRLPHIPWLSILAAIIPAAIALAAWIEVVTGVRINCLGRRTEASETREIGCLLALGVLLVLLPLFSMMVAILVWTSTW